jgi:hypothetical protein
LQDCFGSHRAVQSGRIDVHDLHVDLLALAHFVHAIVRHFGDVQKAVAARHDFDERAEIAHGIPGMPGMPGMPE